MPCCNVDALPGRGQRCPGRPCVGSKVLMRKIRHRLSRAFSLRTVLLLLLLGMGLAPAAVDLDRMLLLASQRYGDAGAATVAAWRDLLTQAAT